MSRCPHCPVPAGPLCKGEWVRRLCELIDPTHPDYDPRYVDTVLAQSERQSQSDYPSLATMAANAVGAAVRFVANGGVMVDQAELERRLGICRACEHFDAQPERCRVCGCVAAWKARLASEHCPLPAPKW